jgi:hypothetical protein
MKINVKNLNENNLINNNSNENIIPIDDLILNQKPNKLIKKEKESIFNTPKNKEFFKKANQIDDIYIVDPLHNINFKQQNTIEEDYENQNQSSIYNYRKISKDYSYNSIFNTNNNISNNNYNNINNNNYLTSDSHNLESNSKNYTKKNLKDDYSQLIQKMADLSEKQVFLIDCITQLKNDFYNVTTNLNNRIERLEKIILNGTPILTNNSIYMNQMNNSNINNYLNNNPIQNLIDENNMNSLLMNISKCNFEDLNEIPLQTLENVIYYLINKIQNEKNIPLDKIISTFKKIIIGIKNQFSNQCIEHLENILKILSTDLNISDSNMVEIKLILSYLKK